MAADASKDAHIPVSLALARLSLMSSLDFSDVSITGISANVSES